MIYSVTLNNIRVVCGRDHGTISFAFNGANYDVPMFHHGRGLWLPIPRDSDAERAKKNALIRLQNVFDPAELSTVLLENIRSEFCSLAVEASYNGGGVYLGETSSDGCTFNDDEYFLRVALAGD